VIDLEELEVVPQLPHAGSLGLLLVDVVELQSTHVTGSVDFELVVVFVLIEVVSQLPHTGSLGLLLVVDFELVVTFVVTEVVSQLLHEGSLGLLLVVVVVLVLVELLTQPPHATHAVSPAGALVGAVVLDGNGRGVRGEAKAGEEIRDNKEMSVAPDPRKSDEDGMVIKE